MEGRTDGGTLRLSPVSTFVAGGLGPQDPGDVTGPGVFDACRRSLQDEGLVLGRPPPEPDLEPEPVVPAGLGQTHVCGLKEDMQPSGGGAQRGSPTEPSQSSDLEGVFVDEDVQTSLHLFGFAEQKQVLEEEDVTLTFPPAAADRELVLPDQLTLLLQVHLQGDQNRVRDRAGSSPPSTGA